MTHCHVVRREDKVPDRKSGNLLSDSWGASDESRSGIQFGEEEQTKLLFLYVLSGSGTCVTKRQKNGRRSDCRKDLQRAVLQVLLLY